MSAPTGKIYPISNWAEICALPPETWDRFAAELPTLIAQTFAVVMACDDIEGIVLHKMRWLDDGKRDIVPSLVDADGNDLPTPTGSAGKG